MNLITKNGWRIIPCAEVRVIYAHEARLRVPKPQMIMTTGCILTAKSNATYRFGGEALVTNFVAQDSFKQEE